MNMKKRFLWILTIALPLIGHSQGVKWTKGLSWQEVKEKARQENKYIFVDAFATWCVPCKKMDREVYTDSNVDKVLNEKFISVRLQMDSTSNDKEDVTKWYSVAQEFNRKYNIQGFPTFLFFSSEGELIHLDIGLKSVPEFIAVVDEASNPLLQDQKILRDFEQGSHDPKILRRAALISKKNKNLKLADSIAALYKYYYLDNLSNDSLFTKANLQFLYSDFWNLLVEEGSQGRIFKYIYMNTGKIDSVYHLKGFSENYIKTIVRYEELTLKLFVNKRPVVNDPNWDSLNNVISSKYNLQYSENIVENYKPLFYLWSGNWSKWAQLFENKIKANGVSKTGNNLGAYTDDNYLNENAWTVFEGCSDRNVLLMAVRWVSLAIKMKRKQPPVDGYYDTKGNLLYKLGNKKKAIKFEKLAVKWTNNFARQQGKSKGFFEDEFNGNIQKMKEGIPTWKN